MKSRKEEFSVWPLMIDMLSSLFIIYIMITMFFNKESVEQLAVERKRAAFVQSFQKVPLLKSEIDNNIDLEGNYDYLQIRFSSLILFDQGRYTLKPQGIRILKDLAFLINDEANKKRITRIQIEGHTDRQAHYETVYPKDNWELSSARALSVLDYLVNYEKCSAKLFSASGFGEYTPASLDEIGKNRRIELKIYFSDQLKLKAK